MNLTSFIDRYNLEFLRGYENLKPTIYGDGEFLIHSGSEIKELTIILEGKVEVSTNTHDGRKFYINVVEELDLIGDIEYLMNQKAQFDCNAIGQVVVLNIPFDFMEEKFGDKIEFWKFLATKSSGKLYRSNHNILIRKNYNTENLIATYLYKHNGEIRYKTLDEVSEYFGISYRQLLRVIKKMEESGSIQRSKGLITILDWAMIEELKVEE